MGVPAIVAQKLRIIAAIIDGDVDVAVIVEISGGQAATCYGAMKSGPKESDTFSNWPFPKFLNISKGSL